MYPMPKINIKNITYNFYFYFLPNNNLFQNLKIINHLWTITW